MKLETKLIIYLCLLAIVDVFIPIPIVAIILIYVLLNKPAWFKKMVLDIYSIN